MINHLQEFEDELYNFLKINVHYNLESKQYLFDNNWTIDTNETYFDNRIQTLKKLLWEHLKNGLENKSFLLETRDKIRAAYNKLYDCDFSDLSFLEQLDVVVRKKSYSAKNQKKEVYDYNYFINKSYKESYKNDAFFNQSDSIQNYHEHMKNLFSNSGNQPTEKEFEEQKLIYTIHMYKEYVMVLLSYVETLYFGCERIDFSQKNSKNSIITPSKKCQVNLSKLDTAQLFSFLFHEGFITMNDEDTNDGSQIKKFIEDNFTYQNQKTKKHQTIKCINKEFSELKWEHKEIQLKFFDDLISKLQAKKNALEKRQKNSS